MKSFTADDKSFKATIKKFNTKLEIEGEQYNPVSLKSPNMGEMNSIIKESLDGKLKVRLYISNKLIMDYESDRASMDIHFK